jgi:hypothetical protein
LALAKRRASAGGLDRGNAENSQLLVYGLSVYTPPTRYSGYHGNSGRAKVLLVN